MSISFNCNSTIIYNTFCKYSSRDECKAMFKYIPLIFLDRINDTVLRKLLTKNTYSSCRNIPFHF